MLARLCQYSKLLQRQPPIPRSVHKFKGEAAVVFECIGRDPPLFVIVTGSLVNKVATTF